MPCLIGKPRVCAGCNRRIMDRFMLEALDRYWHEDCLKCACCDCRLGDVGSTLYTRANLILCHKDYLRLFGMTGNCAACSKVIPAFEMVMRARENVYHLDCFACHLKAIFIREHNGTRFAMEKKKFSPKYSLPVSFCFLFNQKVTGSNPCASKVEQGTFALEQGS
uniref:LIM domain only 1 n=1 Tax=Hucho hucho TaxID=62062 RepID=A0A4W5JJ37_9TELE